MDNDPSKNHNTKSETKPQATSTDISDRPVGSTSTTVAGEKPATPNPQDSSGTSTAQKSPVIAPVDPIVQTNDVVVPGTDQDQPVVVVMKPPKKNKLGIVVAALVLILILIGGIGLGVWYFVVYNDPENIAFDAMRQLFTADNVVTRGEMSNRFTNTSSTTNLVKLKFESASNHLPTTSTISFEISERDASDNIVDNHDISINLGSSVMVDGVIYLQVSKLHEAFERVRDMYYKNYHTDLDTDDSFTTYNEALDAQAKMVEEIVDVIDNEWWQIKVEDIAQTISDALSVGESETKPFVNFYNCMFKVATTDRSTDLVNMYDQARFISITKADRDTGVAGRSFYKAELDFEKMADFMNASARSEASEAMVVCMNDLYQEMGYSQRISVDDLESPTAEDLKSAYPDESEVYLDIADFSHKLHGIIIEAKDPGQEVNVDLDFEYVDAEVTPPENYRPITDLVKEVMQIITDNTDILWSDSDYTDVMEIEGLEKSDDDSDSTRKQNYVMN